MRHRRVNRSLKTGCKSRSIITITITTTVAIIITIIITITPGGGTATTAITITTIIIITTTITGYFSAFRVWAAWSSVKFAPYRAWAERPGFWYGALKIPGLDAGGHGSPDCAFLAARRMCR